MNPLEQFTPPPIQNAGPSTPDNGSNNQAPQQANIPGSQERQSQWARSVGRSHSIKTATTTVIQNRTELVAYLKKSGLDLLTSSIEFQQSGDFITSSYVVYPQAANQKEPLANFISRYQFLKEPVEKIRDTLRPVQSQMQIITKRQY